MFMLMSFLVVLRMGMLVNTMVPGFMLVVVDGCTTFVVVGVGVLMIVEMLMQMKVGMAMNSIAVAVLMLVLVFMRVGMFM